MRLWDTYHNYPLFAVRTQSLASQQLWSLQCGIVDYRDRAVHSIFRTHVSASCQFVPEFSNPQPLVTTTSPLCFTALALLDSIFTYLSLSDIAYCLPLHNALKVHPCCHKWQACLSTLFFILKFSPLLSVVMIVRIIVQHAFIPSSHWGWRMLYCPV